MGGSSKTSSGTNWSIGNSSTNPWDTQESYLKDAFSGASDAYNTTKEKGAYTGDYVAQGDEKNTNAYNQAYNFGTNSDYLGYLSDLLGSASGWVNSGTDYMSSGASGLKGLLGDQTDNYIASAKKYADPEYISGAVDAAMADANRYASENVIPSLYRSAASSNNLNSDRTALAQGVVERGLKEQASDLSAQMYYDAYNSGLDRAASDTQNQRSGYSALYGMGSDSASKGMEGYSSGISNYGSLNEAAEYGSGGLTSLKQASLNNDMAKYEGDSNFPWAALSNFYSIIGDKSWGQDSNWSQIGGEQKTEKSNASTLSKIGGGISALGSLFSGGTDSTAKGIFSFLG